MTKQPGAPKFARALNPTNDTTRIAANLCTTTEQSSQDTADAANASCASQSLFKALDAELRARALRSAHVASKLLGDPGWDMLLELLHAEITNRRVTSAILCKAAGVGAAAGFRWIDALEREGLCTRIGAGSDGCSVRLSEQGSEALRAYFAELGEDPSSGSAQSGTVS